MEMSTKGRFVSVFPLIIYKNTIIWLNLVIWGILRVVGSLLSPTQTWNVSQSERERLKRFCGPLWFLPSGSCVTYFAVIQGVSPEIYQTTVTNEPLRESLLCPRLLRLTHLASIHFISAVFVDSDTLVWFLVKSWAGKDVINGCLHEIKC